MFIGSSYLNLDTKGRFAIPTKYREKIISDNGGEMVLTADHGGKCLALYPFSEWEKTLESLSKLPNMDSGIKDLTRNVFGYASEVKMDGQGRILVSETQRDFAKLEKKVVLVGHMKKFELWNEEAWTGGVEDRVSSAEASIQNNEMIKNFSM